MSQYKTKHYGVEIYVTFEGVPACCGAQQIYSFGAKETTSGAIRKLTLDQKQEMYKELMRKIIPDCSGVLNATDCVLYFGELEGLNRGSSRWNKSESAGDISMEDFCNYFGFTRGPVARNTNSGNLVATWSKAIHEAIYNESNKKLEVKTMEVEAPDFSDEPKPETKGSQDFDELIREIERNLVGQ